MEYEKIFKNYISDKGIEWVEKLNRYFFKEEKWPTGT